MGILYQVVQALMLAVFDIMNALALGSRVAAQLIGDQHTMRLSLLLQQLAQQALGSLLVAPALDKDIENKALLINGALKPVLDAGDSHDELIKVPLVAVARHAPAEALGELSAERQTLVPDCFVCDRRAASGQHLLNLAHA